MLVHFIVTTKLTVLMFRKACDITTFDDAKFIHRSDNTCKIRTLDFDRFMFATQKRKYVSTLLNNKI